MKEFCRVLHNNKSNKNAIKQILDSKEVTYLIKETGSFSKDPKKKQFGKPIYLKQTKTNISSSNHQKRNSLFCLYKAHLNSRSNRKTMSYRDANFNKNLPMVSICEIMNLKRIQKNNLSSSIHKYSQLNDFKNATPEKLIQPDFSVKTTINKYLHLTKSQISKELNEKKMLDKMFFNLVKKD